MIDTLLDMVNNRAFLACLLGAIVPAGPLAFRGFK